MDPFIPVGKARFLFYLDKVDHLLETASSSANPAQQLYQQDLRTPLFMLEALSRLYKKIYDHKKLKKLNTIFKDLEDALGQIDYYDAFQKDFSQKKNIPGEITHYLKEKTEEKTGKLNHYLKEEKWIGKHPKRLSKIKKDLDDVDWFDEKNDGQAILAVYKKEIKKVIKEFKRKEIHFDNIENDVHELRRELRWLSIYPQALCGLMQLKENQEPPFYLKKYLTEEIVHSAFNVMPDGSGLSDHIFLNDQYFYALSWMIAALGKLKDSGLKVEILKESIAEVYKTDEDVEQLVYSICDENQPTIAEILAQSQKIVTTFFEEDILENLVA